LTTENETDCEIDEAKSISKIDNNIVLDYDKLMDKASTSRLDNSHTKNIEEILGNILTFS
jgi:hypothetical protein